MLAETEKNVLAKNFRGSTSYTIVLSDRNAFRVLNHDYFKSQSLHKFY
jgi:hypothetical protein